VYNDGVVQAVTFAYLIYYCMVSLLCCIWVCVTSYYWLCVVMMTMIMMMLTMLYSTKDDMAWHW